MTYKILKNNYEIAQCALADERNKCADLNRRLDASLLECSRLRAENAKLYQLNKDRKHAIVQLAEVVAHVI